MHAQGLGLDRLERVWKPALPAAGVTEEGKRREGKRMLRYSKLQICSD
jgi:hypothetical protein